MQDLSLDYFLFYFLSTPIKPNQFHFLMIKKNSYLLRLKEILVILYNVILIKINRINMNVIVQYLQKNKVLF